MKRPRLFGYIVDIAAISSSVMMAFVFWKIITQGEIVIVEPNQVIAGFELLLAISFGVVAIISFCVDVGEP